MINFPVFHRLRVRGYLLYPGTTSDDGLDIEFRRGPTLIAGVNGLGKSTLIAILLRTLTGPFDIPKAAQDGDLGEVRPSPVKIAANNLFPPRVSDGARDATASMEVSFGDRRVIVERKLADLSLNMFAEEGVDESKGSEAEYQNSVVDLMGVGSFFDALLILRYVVFLMEDRKALVWGKTSQREILRTLFVEPGTASALSDLRHKMMSADSAFRNLRNVMRKRINENKVAMRNVTGVSNVQAQLSVRQAELEAIRQEEDGLERAVAQEEAARLDARLRGAKAALDRDAALRELERAKIRVLQHEFTELEESGLYVLSRLISDDQCLVCDTHRPGLGLPISERIEARKCPICGSPQKPKDTEEIADLSSQRITNLQNRIRRGEEQVRASASEIYRADHLRNELLEQLAGTTENKLRIGRNIRRLNSRLPSDERSLTELEKRNNELQALIDEEEREYKRHRAVFERALEKSEEAVAKSHLDVARAFEEYAGEFLKERCRIAFQPVKIAIGQSGPDFEISLFQLSMSGAAIGGETPRNDPEQVSMSQREFLDLAFRMALMTVASQDGAGTIVVDAPESSLDFRFAERAGNQLARFARAGGKIGNRVVVTNNLANAEIIPAFLGGRPQGETAQARVVNLLELAAPSVAVQDDGEAYADFLELQIKNSETVQ